MTKAVLSRRRHSAGAQAALQTKALCKSSYGTKDTEDPEIDLCSKVT